MNKTIPLAIVIALATSGAAFAHQGGKGLSKRFEKLDADGNGSLSLDELSTGMHKRFTKSDANQDGKVTREEAKAVAETKREEMKAKRAEKRAEKGIQANKRADQREFRKGKRDPEKFGKHLAKRFERMDTDGDGVIVAAEVNGKAKQKFERMDADRNGAVTEQEMRAAMKAKWDKHGRKGKNKGNKGKSHKRTNQQG